MPFAVDDIVQRSMAKWPDVPDVYGWLSLDRRGNWLLKGERIGNAALRDFIARNYACDARGRWFFQNGPQRVFIALAYTPLVIHLEGEKLVDHCGKPYRLRRAYLDDEGSVLLQAEGVIGLLDDRDLARFADRKLDLQPVARAAVPGQFGFVAVPAP